MTGTTPHPLSEFDLIARYFAPIAGEGSLGLRDDAAILVPSPGHDLVLTQDALVAGVHFFADDPPASIARKALRVNLSDLAAKGAKPRGFLMSFARAAGQDEAWLAAFAQGLGDDARLYGCPLLGGDTVRTQGAFFLSLTAIGEVPSGMMVPRQGGQPGAKPGDCLYVSGTIGDGALGLLLRQNPSVTWGEALSLKEREGLLDRYLHPQPRLALAPVLRAYASTAMDISDGLVGDCDKLATGLGRQIEAARVPFSSAVQRAIGADPAILTIALTGGDDYEILCAVPQEKAQAFERASQAAGVPVHAIGTLTATSETLWRAESGAPMVFATRSYAHS